MLNFGASKPRVKGGPGPPGPPGSAPVTGFLLVSMGYDKYINLTCNQTWEYVDQVLGGQYHINGALCLAHRGFIVALMT